MNNYNDIQPRVRNQSLLIVEGNHEKNKLFWLIFKSFPELNIDMDNVWIYGTNIYMLYEDIQKEYDENWYETDVDLPFVISKKWDADNPKYRDDFTNIILVFDYEHHDPNFSEEKILKMQEYFKDSTEMGKLYINYPMIESYQDLDLWIDNSYENKKVSVTLQPGAKYKALVKNTIIAQNVAIPNKMKEILFKRFEVCDEMICENTVEKILKLSEIENLQENIREILADILEEKHLFTAIYQFGDLILKTGYIGENVSYWENMRNIFKKVIFYNISKANKIQGYEYLFDSSKYKQCFERLDFVEILKNQNIISTDEVSGYIWVLSTCVFIVADYNFGLVEE